MKSASYYAKILILSVGLFFETFYLTNLVIQYVQSGKYFDPSIMLMVQIGLMFLAILLTNALLTPTWHGPEKYLAVALPFSAAVFLPIFNINTAYAAVVSVVIMIFMSYELFLAGKMAELLIKFYPRFTLRNITSGIVWIFSILASVIVVINANAQPVMIDKTINNLLDAYVIPAVDDQVNKKIQDTSQQELNRLDLTPEGVELLQKSGLLDNITSGIPQVSLENTLKSEVNKLIEPYKKFVNPLMAVVAFGLIQFLGFLAKLLFSILVTPTLWLAEKVGLHHKMTYQTEKEILVF